MQMKRICALCLLLLLSAGCGPRSDRSHFDEIIFIDHYHFRYAVPGAELPLQIEGAKENIDRAAEWGADTFLFFAKNTFEVTLNYDFELPGIGAVGAKAFPPGSERRRITALHRDALRELVRHAGSRGLKVIFHSNQFNFPPEVLEIIRPAVWGTAVCPGRKTTWQIYRKKLNEFWALFPGISGLQITGDETQVSVLECRCDSCVQLGTLDRVNRLTLETARVCRQHEKELQMRTWQRMGELEQETDLSHMGDGLPEFVCFSVKNTRGDFHATHEVDEAFLRAADPGRLIVEFDAWREYDGNNYYPCYMGDLWAPRFRLLRRLGVKRIAVRLNWNSNSNSIFRQPWGNRVNIHTFTELARNPEREPDEILRDYIRVTFPDSAHEAAFRLYKTSLSFQKSIYQLHGRYIANHSRVQDEDAERDLAYLQDRGFLPGRRDFERRREQINAACSEAASRVEALGEDTPFEWREALFDGIRVQQNVALGSIDKIEAIHHKTKGDRALYNAVAGRLRERARSWRQWHPQSYESMNGADLLRDY